MKPSSGSTSLTTWPRVFHVKRITRAAAWRGCRSGGGSGRGRGGPGAGGAGGPARAPSPSGSRPTSARPSAGQRSGCRVGRVAHDQVAAHAPGSGAAHSAVTAGAANPRATTTSKRPREAGIPPGLLGPVPPHDRPGRPDPGRRPPRPAGRSGVRRRRAAARRWSARAPPPARARAGRPRCPGPAARSGGSDRGRRRPRAWRRWSVDRAGAEHPQPPGPGRAPGPGRCGRVSRPGGCAPGGTGPRPRRWCAPRRAR